MKKIIAKDNCWKIFLASMTGIPLDNLEGCSTIHDDWKEKTEETLARLDLFFAEVNPGLVSQLPHGALVGAHVNGVSKSHIVIAQVERNGPSHGFRLFHDPSLRIQVGTSLQPSRIVLLCKLDK